MEKVNVRRTKYMAKDKVLRDWLKQYSGSSYYKHREGIKKFLSFLEQDIDTVMSEYEEAKDKAQWARNMGLKLVQFYQDLVKKGYNINTARTATISARAFFRDNARALTVRRGAIQRPQIALGEHKFVQAELQKVYYFADTFDKCLLSLGVSIGFSSSDFLDLKRSHIEDLVNWGIENEVDFPYFDYNRGKTKTPGRAFLMPEAIKCLKTYLETTETNEEDRLFNLSPDALNDHLKGMVKASGIRTRGKVKWRLLRKFLFTGLLKATDEISAKMIVGKRVGNDMLTYFLTDEETLRNKYRKAYPYIRLAENGDRISKTEKELQMYKAVLAKMAREAVKDLNPNMSDEDVLALYLRKR